MFCLYNIERGKDGKLSLHAYHCLFFYLFDPFCNLFLQPGKNRINFSNSVKFTVLIGNTHLKKQCHCFYLISRVYFTVHSYVHVFKLFFAFFILKIPK